MDGSGYSEPGSTITTDEDDDFKIKGAVSRAAPTQSSSNAPSLEDCIICLQSITERAVAVPCNHLSFDFICLVSWLQQRETCPLCNATVTEVQFDWRSPSDYKSFEVRPRTTEKRLSQDIHPPSVLNVQRHRHYPNPGPRRANGRDSNSSPPADPAVEKRRTVYQEGLYSHHIGANRISGHRDFTPQEFSNSPLLQRRARIFLRRELQIFSHLDSQGDIRNRGFVLEYIVAMLKKFDPKAADGRAEDLLSEFLSRTSAKLLLHELLAWLRSPHATLVEWDKSVQYSFNFGESPNKGID